MPAAGGGSRHPVIGVQDEAPCQIFTVIALVIFAYDKEGVEDVLGLRPSEAVDVEHGCVDIRSEQRTALGIPSKRRPFVTHVLGIRLKAPRRVGQLENVWGDPFAEGAIRLPSSRLGEGSRGGACDLFDDKIRHASSADFLPRDVIEGQS